MKNPLNGHAKFLIVIVFSAGAIYAAFKIGASEQKETKKIAVSNESRLTVLETQFKYANDYYKEEQKELKADIKTLLSLRSK